METCSKVYLTNQAAVVTTWKLYVKLTTGREVEMFESGNCTVGYGDTIDLGEYLADFNRPIFYIKAAVKAGKDTKTEEMLYDKNSDRTVSFELHGTTFNAHFTKVS